MYFSQSRSVPTEERGETGDVWGPSVLPATTAGHHCHWCEVWLPFPDAALRTAVSGEDTVMCKEAFGAILGSFAEVGGTAAISCDDALMGLEEEEETAPEIMNFNAAVGAQGRCATTLGFLSERDWTDVQVASEHHHEVATNMFHLYGCTYTDPDDEEDVTNAKRELGLASEPEPASDDEGDEMELYGEWLADCCSAP